MTQPGPLPCFPAIGGGTWAWGNRFLWGYRAERDDRRLSEAFRLAIQGGIRFFDSGDSYGTGRLAGRSEVLLGRFSAALSDADRRGLILATKLAPFPWRLTPESFEQAARASRRRLRDRLDLVQLHWSTANYLPWQERPLLEGLARAVEAGTARALGLSNMGPRRLRLVAARMQRRGVPVHSLQVQLSLLCPQAVAPGGLADSCRDLGIRLIAYSPLALGLLGGRYQPGGAMPEGPRGVLFRRMLPGIEPLLGLMRDIGQDHGSGPAAVALNWCRAHGAMPIPGLRDPQQVREIVRAQGWLLNSHERAALDQRIAGLKLRMVANPFQSR